MKEREDKRGDNKDRAKEGEESRRGGGIKCFQNRKLEVVFFGFCGEVKFEFCFESFFVNRQRRLIMID